jgi:hypothetical protein
MSYKKPLTMEDLQNIDHEEIEAEGISISILRVKKGPVIVHIYSFYNKDGEPIFHYYWNSEYLTEQLVKEFITMLGGLIKGEGLKDTTRHYLATPLKKIQPPFY